MSPFLLVGQLIVSMTLIGLVLLQAKGEGLSAALGGEGQIHRTKRGPEKVLFLATIAVATLFALLSILNLVFG